MFQWPPTLLATFLFYVPFIVGLNHGARSNICGVKENWIRINNAIWNTLRGPRCLPSSLGEVRRTVIAAFIAIVSNILCSPYIGGCFAGAGFRWLLEWAFKTYISILDKATTKTTK